MKHLSSILIISLLGFAVSCARPNRSHSTPPVEVIPPVVLEPEPLSILSNFTATSQIVVIRKLNLAALSLNQEQSSDAIFPCTLGQITNTIPLPQDVGEGNVLITGDEQNGVIQFGHLINGGEADDDNFDPAADPECRNVSMEEYSYSIVGDELTLCLTNPLYPFCSTYTKAE